jgi:predicted RNA binding protein YcfA (HicA-like mRNA interferase family)
LPRPALETNRGKVVARLKREGWIPRHGGDHDVYKHPSKPGRIVSRTPPNRLNRGGTRDREDGRLGRLREGNPDNGAIRRVDRR